MSTSVESNMDDGIFIGICFGSAVLFIIIIIVGFKCARKSSEKPPIEFSPPPQQELYTYFDDYQQEPGTAAAAYYDDDEECTGHDGYVIDDEHLIPYEPTNHIASEPPQLVSVYGDTSGSARVQDSDISVWSSRPKPPEGNFIKRIKRASGGKKSARFKDNETTSLLSNHSGRSRTISPDKIDSVLLYSYGENTSRTSDQSGVSGGSGQSRTVAPDKIDSILGRGKKSARFKDNETSSLLSNQSGRSITISPDKIDSVLLYSYGENTSRTSDQSGVSGGSGQSRTVAPDKIDSVLGRGKKSARFKDNETTSLLSNQSGRSITISPDKIDSVLLYSYGENTSRTSDQSGVSGGSGQNRTVAPDKIDSVLVHNYGAGRETVPRPHDDMLLRKMSHTRVPMIKRRSKSVRSQLAMKANQEFRKCQSQFVPHRDTALSDVHPRDSGRINKNMAVPAMPNAMSFQRRNIMPNSDTGIWDVHQRDSGRMNTHMSVPMMPNAMSFQRRNSMPNSDTVIWDVHPRYSRRINTKIAVPVLPNAMSFQRRYSMPSEALSESDRGKISSVCSPKSQSVKEMVDSIKWNSLENLKKSKGNISKEYLPHTPMEIPNDSYNQATEDSMNSRSDYEQNRSYVSWEDTEHITRSNDSGQQHFVLDAVSKLSTSQGLVMPAGGPPPLPAPPTNPYLRPPSSTELPRTTPSNSLTTPPPLPSPPEYINPMTPPPIWTLAASPSPESMYTPSPDDQSTNHIPSPPPLPEVSPPPAIPPVDPMYMPSLPSKAYTKPEMTSPPLTTPPPQSSNKPTSEQELKHTPTPPPLSAVSLSPPRPVAKPVLLNNPMLTTYNPHPSQHPKNTSPRPNSHEHPSPNPPSPAEPTSSKPTAKPVAKPVLLNNPMLTTYNPHPSQHPKNTSPRPNSHEHPSPNPHSPAEPTSPKPTAKPVLLPPTTPPQYMPNKPVARPVLLQSPGKLTHSPNKLNSFSYSDRTPQTPPPMPMPPKSPSLYKSPPEHVTKQIVPVLSPEYYWAQIPPVPPPPPPASPPPSPLPDFLPKSPPGPRPPSPRSLPPAKYKTIIQISPRIQAATNSPVRHRTVIQISPKHHSIVTERMQRFDGLSPPRALCRTSPSSPTYFNFPANSPCSAKSQKTPKHVRIASPTSGLNVHTNTPDGTSPGTESAVGYFVDNIIGKVSQEEVLSGNSVAFQTGYADLDLEEADNGDVAPDFAPAQTSTPQSSHTLTKSGEWRTDDSLIHSRMWKRRQNMTDSDTIVDMSNTDDTCTSTLNLSP